LAFFAGYAQGYASAHFALGWVLARLRDEGVLIVVSGFSDHSMRGFGPQAEQPLVLRKMKRAIGFILSKPCLEIMGLLVIV
jgi:aromatic ring-opening dioxygenase catalytic subunit (LigB family)